MDDRLYEKGQCSLTCLTTTCSSTTVVVVVVVVVVVADVVVVVTSPYGLGPSEIVNDNNSTRKVKKKQTFYEK